MMIDLPRMATIAEFGWILCSLGIIKTVSRITIMKQLIYGFFSALILATQPNDAAITLGYPGNEVVDGRIEVFDVGETGKSGVYKIVIGPFYRFMFTGIETYGNDEAGAEGGNGIPIHFDATIKVDGGSDQGPVSSPTITYTDVSLFNTSDYVHRIIDPAITYVSDGVTPITLEVTFRSNIQGGANTATPNGHFNLLGTSQAHPRVPTGSLHIPAGPYLLEGADPHPELQATIVRD
jgi:hypothetical protein